MAPTVLHSALCTWYLVFLYVVFRHIEPRGETKPKRTASNIFIFSRRYATFKHSVVISTINIDNINTYLLTSCCIRSASTPPPP